MSAFRILVYLAIAFMVGLGGVPQAAAQGATGSITVTVQDPAGSLVPQAVLELRDQGTNEVRKAITSGSGTYTFANLPFGLYSLSIAAVGFKREVYGDVQVQTARATEINANLKLGGATETVEVAGAVPLVESSSSAVATTDRYEAGC